MWKPGERDLGGAREVQLVCLERVDVRALGREEAGAVHRLLAHEDRRDHRRVAVRGGTVEGEAVERHRDERRVAGDVPEARAREPRRALELEAPDLGVLGPGRARLPDAADLDGVLVGRRRRARRGRAGSGTATSRASRSASASASSASATLSSSFAGASSASCSGVGLPFSFSFVLQLLDPRHERPPACVRREERVEVHCRLGVLARERGTEALGIVAGCPDVDHGV